MGRRKIDKKNSKKKFLVIRGNKGGFKKVKLLGFFRIRDLKYTNKNLD